MRPDALVILGLVVAAGCASKTTLPPDVDPPKRAQLRVYAPVAGGVIDDVAVDRATQPIERGDLVVAVAEGESDVRSGTSGVSVAGRNGKATNMRYGIAYAPYAGTAHGGAGSVAVTRAGLASSGDGGVSVEKNGGYAECGACGVAYTDTPRTKITGRVRGGRDSVLVIVGRRSVGGGELEGVARVAQVGTTVDGVRIEPGRWYGLDANLRFVEVTGP